MKMVIACLVCIGLALSVALIINSGKMDNKRSTFSMKGGFYEKECRSG
ncbi:MAG: hypothetical protein JW827_00775 [Spirochaetes bacterium]|nr:hypothetical protein [Spirochaetota bacterium]